jgi:acetyl esterase
MSKAGDRFKRRARRIARLAIYTLLCALPLAAAAAPAEQQTSENDERLAGFLEKNPKADTNQDGALTMEEVRAFRNQQRPQQGRQPQRPAPTHADVSYGPHERNVVDFWRAETEDPAPLLVFFHGGGFRGGDKRAINNTILDTCLEAGVSCAAANYRLSGQAPYPAQMHDSARAIQFLRSKAEEWNIDKTRLSAYGGSAGSGISLWLAFHDDMADPKSDDPVSRQSTRLTCAIGLQMQDTYDPRVIREIIPGPAYDNVALKLLHGLPETWDWDKDEIDASLGARLEDCSPITHLTPDDPPVFLYHRKEQETLGNIHHANFGRHLKTAMDKLGIECVHQMNSDYESNDEAFKDVAAFAIGKFGAR